MIGYLQGGTSGSDRIQNTLPVAAYSTGAYDLKACVAMDNWEPASFRATAISHHRGQITVRARGGANAGDPGKPDLAWHDGATINTITPNATLPDGLTAYQWVWVRAVFNPNNGSNRIADFYYSLDPETTPVGSVSWTQIGTQVVEATTTVRAATSTVAGFGGDSTMTGATPNNGRYAVAQLSLAGTVIHSPDLRDGNQGWASPPATDDQGNSWALNGAAVWEPPTTDQIIGRSVHYDFANRQVVIESGV